MLDKENRRGLQREEKIVGHANVYQKILSIEPELNWGIGRCYAVAQFCAAAHCCLFMRRQNEVKESSFGRLKLKSSLMQYGEYSN